MAKVQTNNGVAEQLKRTDKQRVGWHCLAVLHSPVGIEKA
jgi:hypothetical protein